MDCLRSARTCLSNLRCCISPDMPSDERDQQAVETIEPLYDETADFKMTKNADNIGFEADENINESTECDGDMVDAFLSHDWGVKNQNHQKVAIINSSLQKSGMKTWLDTDDGRMKGNVQEAMAKGIEQSRMALVFITQKYHDKVNGDAANGVRDNCYREYKHCIKQLGPERMLAVIMEHDMANDKNWKGKLGMDMADKIYVQMSGNLDDKVYFNDQMAELQKQINTILATQPKKKESMIDSDWYFGSILRIEAETILSTWPKGTFIVRDSESQPGTFALSLRTAEDETAHYRIRKLDSGHFLLAKENKFTALQDLVEHYKIYPGKLPCLLTQACPNNPRITEKVQKELSSFAVEGELRKEDLKLNRNLGAGRFGEVRAGMLKNMTHHVAVKTLTTDVISPILLVTEAAAMTKMNHVNVVQVCGVCIESEPFLIVTEYVCNGSLHDFLTVGEGDQWNKLDSFIDMMAQVATGMAYLESQHYVHGNLAARNILVGEGYICKVTDFGLAKIIKDSERGDQNKIVTYDKWTAPEISQSNIFTTKSDVWAFGIVLVEIITKGGVPYPDMTDEEVISRVSQGYRMAKPKRCPEVLYKKLIELCWYKDASQRPTFEYLKDYLNDFFQASLDDYSDGSARDQAQQIRNEWLQK